MSEKIISKHWRKPNNKTICGLSIGCLSLPIFTEILEDVTCTKCLREIEKAKKEKR
jgi:hypothetical protein